MPQNENIKSGTGDCQNSCAEYCLKLRGMSSGLYNPTSKYEKMANSKDAYLHSEFYKLEWYDLFNVTVCETFSAFNFLASIQNSC